MDYNFKLSYNNFSVSNSFHSIDFSIFCKAAFLSEGAKWNIPRKPQSENWGAGVGEQPIGQGHGKGRRGRAQEENKVDRPGSKNS